MNRLLSVGIAAIVLASLPAVAADQAPTAPAAGQTRTPAPDGGQREQQMAQMQANMQAMQAQMEKIRQSKNPAERQRLMQEHMATLQSAMGTIRGMMGPGMMGAHR